MEINDAIRISREHVAFLRRCAERTHLLADDYLREAEAVETICDALEREVTHGNDSDR